MVDRSVSDRLTGVDFEFYRSVWVEKILTGFISASDAVDYRPFSTMFETQSIPTSIGCDLLNEKELVNNNSKNTECQYRYLNLVEVTS